MLYRMGFQNLRGSLEPALPIGSNFSRSLWLTDANSPPLNLLFLCFCCARYLKKEKRKMLLWVGNKIIRDLKNTLNIDPNFNNIHLRWLFLYRTK